MNRLSTEKRKQIVASLVEGNSIRATCRMTGASKNTVVKLLADLGLLCAIHHDRLVRDVRSERIQADEIWSFVYAKKKNVPVEKQGEAGDAWTWVAMDPDSKLVVSYHVGSRELPDARAFMTDLAKRLRNRVQLTTDGYTAYLTAVADAFGPEVDYAQLVKLYGSDTGGAGRYSPARLIGIDQRRVTGNPDSSKVSTSYIEHQNLTMRMSMRRMTRLTNGFSKKLDNLAAAVSLHFFHYNFVRVHKTLGTTPAVAAGLSERSWSLDDLIGLLDAAERVPIKRGAYAKRAA